jgi:hypothetical protein
LFIAGGRFALAGNHASVLLGVLTPIVHIRKESNKAALRWSLERMRQELLRIGLASASRLGSRCQHRLREESQQRGQRYVQRSHFAGHGFIISLC